MLKELEAMGFKQVNLNKEILRSNDYNMEQSVDDLCEVSDWDPILEELQETGFCDAEMNKKLLVKNNGSIKRVVMDLISGQFALRSLALHCICTSAMASPPKPGNPSLSPTMGQLMIPFSAMASSAMVVLSGGASKLGFIFCSISSRLHSVDAAAISSGPNHQVGGLQNIPALGLSTVRAFLLPIIQQLRRQLVLAFVILLLARSLQASLLRAWPSFQLCIFLLTAAGGFKTKSISIISRDAATLML